MVSTLFRDPQAFSNILVAFGTLQPQAIRSLNRIETLDSASNYYLSYSGRLRHGWIKNVTDYNSIETNSDMNQS